MRPLPFFIALTTGSLAAQQGAFSVSGTGCPAPACSANAIFENLPIGAWDIDGTSITFSPNAATYHADVAGAPLTLTNPTSAGSGDDTITGPFPLGFTFRYAGGSGSTQGIEISSNGYVYLEPGTISSSRCCANAKLASFLDDTPSIAVLGADLSPNAGGIVHFESMNAVNPISLATEPVFVVEWLQVPEFATSNSNTAQCQLWSSGDITICHIATAGSASTDTALVGVSTGGGQPRCGGIDLSASLPFAPSPPFGQSVPIALQQSSATPNVASPFPLVAVNIPPGVSFGAMQLASSTGNLPLSLIGAPPGCNLLVSATFFSLPMTVTPPTAQAMLNIPNNPSVVGLSFHVQGVFGDLTQLGAYAIPVLVSNRGDIVIGQSSPNDECATATPITDGLISGDNLGATTSTMTASCGLMSDDVWFRYVATCTGTATISFCSAGGSVPFDSILAAFTGSCRSLTEIACNDDACGLASEITFPTISGNTYYIAAGAFNGHGTGPFMLAVSCQ